MLDGRVEIITGRDRRRRWGVADKLRIVAEAEEPGACFSHVACRNEISRGLLWNWRSQVRSGALRPEPSALFLPVQVADTPPAVLPEAQAPRLHRRPDPAARAAAEQIEVELPDGSKLRVGAEVSLVALHRVISALRR